MVLRFRYFLILIILAVFSIYNVALADDDGVTLTVTVSEYSAVCSNNIVDAGEQCDGLALGGATCVSQGFSSGSLSCNSNCTFNTSSCVSAAAAPLGGGGGGGSIVTSSVGNSTVVFSGRAYPKSTVTLLKDAQVAASTIAGPDSNFVITLNNLSAGNFIFSIYAEDKDGQRSSLFSFTVSVTANVTTNVTGIFIAPTIGIDKSEVKRGEDITFFGQSLPNAKILITVNSDEAIFTEAVTSKDGVYLRQFDTTPLEFGSHSVKSKSVSSDGAISPFSAVAGFVVGTKNVAAPKPVKKVLKGDSNGDSKVNLVDFSIVAYWYKRASPPAKVDLNGDGKVDLIDFSIMAYYWTG